MSNKLIRTSRVTRYRVSVPKTTAFSSPDVVASRSGRAISDVTVRSSRAFSPGRRGRKRTTGRDIFTLPGVRQTRHAGIEMEPNGTCIASGTPTQTTHGTRRFNQLRHVRRRCVYCDRVTDVIIGTPRDMIMPGVTTENVMVAGV